MDKISRRRRISENTLSMITLLVKKLNFNGLTEYGNTLLLCRDSKIDKTGTPTKTYPRKLSVINKTLH